MSITHIVIHYSATPPERSVSVAEIDSWHRARGFKKIGYHYVIHQGGKVERGRAESEIGAHVANQNTGKIGICFIGGLGKDGKGFDSRTPEQTAAMIGLIEELLTRYPGAKVVGHRDLAATECPGFDVVPWWASVRAGKADPVPSKPSTDPVRSFGEGTVIGEGLRLRRSPAGNIITNLSRGTKVTLLEANGEWHRVRLADGQEGWVASRYLDIVRGEDDVEIPAKAEKTGTLNTGIGIGAVGTAVSGVGSAIGGLHPVVQGGALLLIAVALFLLWRDRANIAKSARGMLAGAQ